MAKKKRRRSSAPKTGCKSGIIRFRAHGKVVEFKGKQGPSCGPRRKPTPPPKHFRVEFARQAKACKGSKHGAFIKCMKRLQYS